MEVRISAADGSHLPDNCVINVGMGDVQKQARYDPKKLYRFDKARQRAKIDVYKLMGSAEVMINDLDDPSTHNVSPVGSDGPSGLSLNVNVVPVKPQKSAGDPPVKNAKAETSAKARKYLQEQQVESLLTNAMRALLQKMPTDSTKFLADFITTRGVMPKAAPDAGSGKGDNAIPGVSKESLQRLEKEVSELRQSNIDLKAQLESTRADSKRSVAEPEKPTVEALTAMFSKEIGDRFTSDLAAALQDLPAHLRGRVSALTDGELPLPKLVSKQIQMHNASELAAAVQGLPAALKQRLRTVRTEVEEEEAAALKIQAIQRGKSARKDLAAKKEALVALFSKEIGDRFTSDLAAALQDLPAHLRKRVSALTDGELPLPMLAIKQVQMRNVSELAAALQSLPADLRKRLRTARTELEEEEAAALKIQAIQRGKSARKELADAAKQKEKKDEETLGSLLSDFLAVSKEEDIADAVKLLPRGLQTKVRTIASAALTNVCSQEIGKRSTSELVEALKGLPNNLGQRIRTAHMELEKEQTAAAVKIQAVHRGKASRKTEGPKALLVSEIQKRNTSELADALGSLPADLRDRIRGVTPAGVAKAIGEEVKKLNPSELVAALEGLPAGFRQRLQTVRKEFDEEKAAAVKIQATHRGKQTRTNKAGGGKNTPLMVCVSEEIKKVNTSELAETLNRLPAGLRDRVRTIATAAAVGSESHKLTQEQLEGALGNVFSGLRDPVRVAAREATIKAGFKAMLGGEDKTMSSFIGSLSEDQRATLRAALSIEASRQGKQPRIAGNKSQQE